MCECDDTAFCGVSVSYKHHGYVDVCVCVFFFNMNAHNCRKLGIVTCVLFKLKGENVFLVLTLTDCI